MKKSSIFGFLVSALFLTTGCNDDDFVNHNSFPTSYVGEVHITMPNGSVVSHDANSYGFSTYTEYEESNGTVIKNQLTLILPELEIEATGDFFGYETQALPFISTGVYGADKTDVAKIESSSVLEIDELEDVRVVVTESDVKVLFNYTTSQGEYSVLIDGDATN